MKRILIHFGFCLGLVLSFPACFVISDWKTDSLSIEVTQSPNQAWVNQDTVRFAITCTRGTEPVPCPTGFTCNWVNLDASVLGANQDLALCNRDYLLSSERDRYEFSIQDVRSSNQRDTVILPAARIVQMDTTPPVLEFDSELRFENGRHFAVFGFIDSSNPLALASSDSGAPIKQFLFCSEMAADGQCTSAWQDCEANEYCLAPNAETGQLGRIFLEPNSAYKQRLAIKASDLAGNNSNPSSQNYYLNFRNQIAASVFTTCAIGQQTSERIQCWGDSRFGTLGNGAQLLEEMGRSEELTAEGLDFGKDGRICEVVAGKHGFCALGKTTSGHCPKVLRHNEDFQLTCWGAETESDGSLSVLKPSLIVHPEDLGWRSVSLAESHYCALDQAGRLYCWGQNPNGELGTGNTDSLSGLIEVSHPNDEIWALVSVAKDFTCAADIKNQVWCWGKNWGATPVKVGDSTRRVCEMAVNDTHLFLHGASSLDCIGDSELAVVVRGQNEGAAMSTAYIARLRARGENFCRQRAEEWACIGDNEWGQLGQLDPTQTLTLPSVDESGKTQNKDISVYNLTSAVTEEDYRDLALSSHHWCALRTELKNESLETKVFCAGFDLYGQVSGPSKPRPVNLAGTVVNSPNEEDDWSTVSAGTDHSCGLTSQGAVYCWGRDHLGQMGSSRQPVDRLGLARPMNCQVNGVSRRFKSVTAGELATMAITTQNEICIWTEDPYLNASSGVDSSAGSNAPVILTPALFRSQSGEFEEITLGKQHACVRSSDESLHCWGRNQNGMIPGQTAKQIPRAIGELIPFSQMEVHSMSAGRAHTCFIQGVGTSTVTCEGENSLGQLGLADPLSDRTQYFTPGRYTVSSGQNYTCAALSPDREASIVCWGRLSYHADHRWWPAVSPFSNEQDTLTLLNSKNLLALSAGKSHFCTILSNTSTTAGNLACVGDNSHGQLGPGSSTTNFEPNLSLSDVWEKPFRSVSAGGAHTCGVDEAGELYCWGSNAYGQLGSGQNAGVSVPIPVEAE